MVWEIGELTMPAEIQDNGLREILRRYPTGVTIVTALLDGKPWGGTMNSFTSVSLDPPLIAIFVMEKGRTTTAINQTGKFVVNILKFNQEKEAKQFASDNVPDKFLDVSYRESSNGIPIIEGSLGYIECDLYDAKKISDHIMFLGKVTRSEVTMDEEALVFYRRAFRSFTGTV